MAKQWTLTVRNGPRVERLRFDDLASAIDAMEERLAELTPQVRREVNDILKRRFDAVRRVAVRAEISGPGGLMSAIHGGVDVRGDGSEEAYTGRFRRSLLRLAKGESAYDALRRELAEHSD